MKRSCLNELLFSEKTGDDNVDENVMSAQSTAPGLTLNKCGFDEWYGSGSENIKRNILKGRILVAGSGINGRSFLFSQAEHRSETGGVVGVEAKTIDEIALPIAAEALVKTKSDEELKKIRLHPIPTNKASGIILGIIRRESGLAREMLTKNTADELLRVINMLRMNCCAGLVKGSGFDLDATIKSYEKYLEEKCIYDTARLLTEAIAYLEKPENRETCTALIPEYALLNDHVPTVLEKRLLALLTGGNCNVIQADTNMTVKPTFFKTYGMSDEILTIARRIKNNKLHPGDVEVYYTSPSYMNVIRAVFGAAGIPVYLFGGRPAEETEYFRLWMSLLDWWKNNCRMEFFESIVLNRNLKLSITKDDKKERSAKEDVLGYFRRNSGYLFGRENLMNIAGLNKSSAGDTEKVFTDIKELAVFFVSELVGIFCNRTDENTYTPMQTSRPVQLFERLSDFVNRYSSGRKSKAAEEKLREVISCNDSDYTFDEFYDLMVKLIGSLRIGEKSDADAVLAVGLSGRKSKPMRKNVFIVGMSSSLMLQKTDESPLISDKMIMELLGDEELASLYQGCTKNDLMLRSVEYLKASVSGKEAALTVSYPYYDQSDLRLRSSSYIVEDLLDGGEITEDNNSLGFLSSCDTFAVKNDQNIFSVEPAEKDETDEAEKNIIFSGINEAVRKKEKEEAARKKEQKKDKDSRADAAAESDTGTVSGNNDTENTEQTEGEASEKADDNKLQLDLSASSFHTLLCCPRRYAIEKLFYISNEPEENIPHTWLDRAKRGSFFHSVMEDYLGKFCIGSSDSIRDESGNVAKLYFDEKLFASVFDGVVKKYSLVPCELASEKERELGEIRETAVAYLKDLCGEDDGYAPFAMEYKFTGEVSDDLDRIKLNYRIGFLDRIDAAVKDKTLHFRIVDYKTGKMDTFIKNYTRLLVQHYVYIKALKNELDTSEENSTENDARLYFEKLKNSGQADNAVVDGFVFVFPFDENKTVYKYDGEKFTATNDKTNFTKIIFEGEPELNDGIETMLNRIADAFNKGDYPDHTFNDDIIEKGKNTPLNDVAYCPYKEICGGCRKEDGK